MKPIRAVVLATATLALVVSPMVESDVQAQRRGGRRAASPRAGGVVVAAYYRPAFISPFYYHPFYDPWWYPYPYGWSRPYRGYGYGRYYVEGTASLRLQVTPRETQVYVDGYYAGEVDDFDGVFQRLRLEPGSHDIALYLPGHRTTTQGVFLQHGGTFRIRHTMEVLGAGEAGDVHPVPRPGAPSADSRARDRDQARRVDPRDDPRSDNAVRGDANFGAIAIRVQPSDAEVLIDGEEWEGPQDDEALVVQIAPGSHRLEVRKSGYRSYSSEVVVTAAETTPINISLPRQ